MNRIIGILLVAVMVLSLCACGNETKNPDEFYNDSFYEEFPTGDEIFTIEIEKNPQAVLTLTDGSEVVIELCYEAAPNAVANFIAFADEKIYDKMGFTDVRNNCIVMTGAMEGDFEPPYYVQDELDHNALSHTRGTVSMIRTSYSDTLTGQFFILTEDQVHFDSNFTAFGKVIEGMENIDKIAASEVDDDDKILTPVGIEKVKVNTYGAKMPSPTIILK
ncbi:MAG: peptidylprolyl isomerase [Clostridia bacterium]|nr:peptidylprolyl isomerase [Clostridia bacterium]